TRSLDPRTGTTALGRGHFSYHRQRLPALRRLVEKMHGPQLKTALSVLRGRVIGQDDLDGAGRELSRLQRREHIEAGSGAERYVDEDQIRCEPRELPDRGVGAVALADQIGVRSLDRPAQQTKN